MGWKTYYKLLEKHNGDLSKATDKEMKFARKDNPNDPSSARAFAEERWGELNDKSE